MPCSAHACRVVTTHAVLCPCMQCSAHACRVCVCVWWGGGRVNPLRCAMCRCCPLWSASRRRTPPPAPPPPPWLGAPGACCGRSRRRTQARCSGGAPSRLRATRWVPPTWWVPPTLIANQSDEGTGTHNTHTLVALISLISLITLISLTHSLHS